MHVMDIAQNAVAAGAANTRILLRMDPAADRLELTVEDDGRGMTEEQAHAALDPFYTSRTTRKVGLGLPLLRLTAQLTGGDVAIESAPGKGTRVTAWFGLSHIDRPPLGDMAGTISAEPSDQTWYTQFRIGTYLNDEFTYNEGSQFPQGEDVLDQFFRQMTPDTGMDNAAGDQSIDNTVVAQAVAAAIDEIYDRTGQDSILVTHSQGGLPGWEVPLYTDHVAAIVAIEPGGAPEVDSDAYSAMVEQNIPVTFYYGDYIGEEFTDVPAAAMWSMMAASADTFTEAYNAAGGSSTVVHLPDEGITGNDHFMFQDLNNDVIADHIENWIQENVDQ